MDTSNKRCMRPLSLSKNVKFDLKCPNEWFELNSYCDFIVDYVSRKYFGMIFQKKHYKHKCVELIH